MKSKALSSKAPATKQEARRFLEKERTNIDRIAHQLHARRFKFAPQKPVLIKKPGSITGRPVVVAPIPNRIVQRAILDTLQELPQVKAQLCAGFNFGGVPGDKFGVPGAILAVLEAIQEKSYYIRTDIKSFFTRVPRKLAVDLLLRDISDEWFLQLAREAIETELDDTAMYESDLQLFPLHDAGVAQGSCLSPLLCNLLLTHFDAEMNTRGIKTVRYIDDFILLAKNKDAAFRAFGAGRQILEKLGLECYDPRLPADKKKADHGLATNTLTFLGCELSPVLVRPSKANRAELLDTLRQEFRGSIVALKNPDQAVRKHATFAETVVTAGKIVQGWANTFSFCTDERLMANLDTEIDKLFEGYEVAAFRTANTFGRTARRRAIGVFSVVERVNSVARRSAVAIISRSRTPDA